NYSIPCEVIITPDGKIVRYQRKSQLPYLLGDSWSLALEPLPTAGQTSWQSKRDLEIAQKETMGWSPHAPVARTTNYPATETVDYSIENAAGDAPIIHRTYAMLTTEQANGAPVFSQKGTGKITFDAKLGVIGSIDETYELQENDPQVAI